MDNISYVSGLKKGNVLSKCDKLYVVLEIADTFTKLWLVSICNTSWTSNFNWTWWRKAVHFPPLNNDISVISLETRTRADPDPAKCESSFLGLSVVLRGYLSPSLLLHCERMSYPLYKVDGTHRLVTLSANIWCLIWTFPPPSRQNDEYRKRVALGDSFMVAVCLP